MVLQPWFNFELDELRSAGTMEGCRRPPAMPTFPFAAPEQGDEMKQYTWDESQRAVVDPEGAEVAFFPRAHVKLGKTIVDLLNADLTLDKEFSAQVCADELYEACDEYERHGTFIPDRIERVFAPVVQYWDFENGWLTHDPEAVYLAYRLARVSG